MAVNFGFNIIKKQMRQRAYQKQNNYSMGLQPRLRQYSHMESHRQELLRDRQPKRQYNYYGVEAFQNRANNMEDASPYDRYAPRQTLLYAADGKISKHDGIGNYTRQRSQLAQKVDYEEQMPRFNKVQAYNPREDTFADHSFGQNSLQVESLLQNKRETAKRKGMDVKMTNIESINDKINSLLKMVKKDKIDRSSKEKNSENSPKRFSPSPTAKKQNVPTSINGYQNKQPINVGGKDRLLDRYQDNSKSNKRLKTYSGIQSSKYDQYDYNKVKESNEEDRYALQASSFSPHNKYSPSNYKPNPKETNNYDKIVNQKPRYNQKGDFSEYKQTPARQHQEKRSNLGNLTELKRDGSKQYPNITPSKYKNNIQQQKKSSPDRASFKDKPQRTPPKNRDAFMPISIVQDQPDLSRSFYDKNQQTSGMKLVDNQLKKIKEKINQSQYQYKKYQERLQNNRQQRSPSNAGKIYTTDPASSNKKFQIKVHPVINDKPETVKIAQKFCFQIELDSRMRKARQSFEKIEGEEKWKDLQSRLSKQGIRLTFIEIKQLLAITPDEFSPFDSQARDEDISKPFIDAQKYWQKEVSCCANSKSLKKQGFNVSELDVNRKGYLSIEDFVCFVNLYTGHCYKNRDLVVIFRRLQNLQKCKKANTIEFNTFFRAFTI